MNPRPLHEWHEDHGNVLWFLWPIEEPPYVGTPLDLGRTVSFDITVQIGTDTYEVEPSKIGDTGGWPWKEADEETLARLFWMPLPDVDAIDVAIRDYIRGGPDPLEEPKHERFSAAPTAYLGNLSRADLKAETHAILYQPSANSMRAPVLIVTQYLDDQESVAAKVAEILNKHWTEA